MNTLRLTIILLLGCLLSACATVQQIPPYTAGSQVDSLSASVSLSLHTVDRSMAGNGVMVYRKPDTIHMVMLSPFGTTMMEIFALGEQITLVYPAQGVAYSGRFDELPNKGGLQGWRMMRWVLDTDIPGRIPGNRTIERVGRQGFKEEVSFTSGVVTSKTNPDGDQVYYSDYKVINGIPYAAEIEIRNKQEDRIRLTLDDVELNSELSTAAFTPRLDGLKLLPLSELQGI